MAVFPKTKEFIQKLQENQTMTLTIIGRANINHWAGEDHPQVIINDYEIKDTTLEF